MILGNGGPAADAHNAAVAAHVMMVTGASDPVFEAAQAAETSATISMEKILMHKYIAMFSHVEAYSDWRRTDYPSLSPNPNGILNAIPRRLPMSGDERVNNPNATVVNDILSPVWWDE